jgi:hypothetical protein
MTLRSIFLIVFLALTPTANAQTRIQFFSSKGRSIPARVPARSGHPGPLLGQYHC